MAMKKIKFRGGDSGVLYLRVSDTSQVRTELDPEGMSLPAQRRKCQERLSRLSLSALDEFIEPGESATDVAHRPQYQAMMRRLTRDGSLSFVLVYSVSRLHRNWPAAGEMVNQLHAMGVRIISATEEFDDRTPEGRMMLGILMSVHAYQSDANSADVRFKMTQKALVGGTPGFVAPGFMNVRVKYDGHDVNTVVLDPERAPFVTRASSGSPLASTHLTTLRIG